MSFRGTPRTLTGTLSAPGVTPHVLPSYSNPAPRRKACPTSQDSFDTRPPIKTPHRDSSCQTSSQRTTDHGQRTAVENFSENSLRPIHQPALKPKSRPKSCIELIQVYYFATTKKMGGAGSQCSADAQIRPRRAENTLVCELLWEVGRSR